MSKNEKCNCPFCNQVFEPESGLTRDEHLAKGIIQIYRQMQEDSRHSDLPCPRCGNEQMKPKLITNSLSRQIDVYVCDECGTDEAIRDMRKDALPLTVWYIVKALLNGFGD